MSACRYEHLEIAKYLVSVGANIDNVNNFTQNDIYDLFKMGVKNFGKFTKIYKECMVYHNELNKKCMDHLLPDLISLVLKY